MVLMLRLSSSILFFFNDTATTEIYTLSLHDALPIYLQISFVGCQQLLDVLELIWHLHFQHFLHSLIDDADLRFSCRSEEHTSELQSHLNLVCRLLLEKKNSIQAEHCSRPRAYSTSYV